MSEPQLFTYDGKKTHRSVGAWIPHNGGYVLLERLKKPYGFGAVAGHVDVGEDTYTAFVREVKEESGLDIVKSKLLVSNLYIPFDTCRHGIEGHVWDVYLAKGEGELILKADEANGIGIYGRESIEAKLNQNAFEPAWQYLIPKLDLLNQQL